MLLESWVPDARMARMADCQSRQFPIINQTPLYIYGKEVDLWNMQDIVIIAMTAALGLFLVLVLQSLLGATDRGHYWYYRRAN